MDEKYNGYTNYETWLMGLNISAAEGLIDETLAMKNELDKYELAEYFCDNIASATEREIEGHVVYIISDLFSPREFNAVNWEELTELLILEE